MLSLTPTELYVATMMCRDYTSHEIAEEMGVTDIAVRQHVLKIKDKTGIRTHAGLGAYLATNKVQTKTNKGDIVCIHLSSVGLLALA
jgi:DNA-binding CsgD family transcriptional regulator